QNPLHLPSTRRTPPTPSLVWRTDSKEEADRSHPPNGVDAALFREGEATIDAADQAPPRPGACGVGERRGVKDSLARAHETTAAGRGAPKAYRLLPRHDATAFATSSGGTCRSSSSRRAVATCSTTLQATSTSCAEHPPVSGHAT